MNRIVFAQYRTSYSNLPYASGLNFCVLGNYLYYYQVTSASSFFRESTSNVQVGV